MGLDELYAELPAPWSISSLQYLKISVHTQINRADQITQTKENKKRNNTMKNIALVINHNGQKFVFA